MTADPSDLAETWAHGRRLDAAANDATARTEAGAPRYRPIVRTEPKDTPRG